MADDITAGHLSRIPRTVLAGRVLSGLAILFLAMDAGGKLLVSETMIATARRSGCPPIPASIACSAEF